MILEMYVIGSILLVAVFVVAMVHLSPDPYDEVFKCPRCGAIMQDYGGSTGWTFVYHVVPPPLMRICPQCGYSEMFAGQLTTPSRETLL